MYDGPYNFKLTDHIRLYEFIVSASRPDLAKKIRFNELDGIKAHYLATTILEPTRKRFGEPLVITSGKCSVELNSIIRPDNPNSDHLWEGPSVCADFIIRGVASVIVYNWIRDKLPHAYGQLIYYPNKHIHVSLPTHTHHYEAWIDG
jgi:hypothetical protein